MDDDFNACVAAARDALAAYDAPTQQAPRLRVVEYDDWRSGYVVGTNLDHAARFGRTTAGEPCCSCAPPMARDLDPEEERRGHAMHRTISAAAQHRAPRGTTEALVLDALRRNPGASSRELADALGWHDKRGQTNALSVLRRGVRRGTIVAAQGARTVRHGPAPMRFTMKETP